MKYLLILSLLILSINSVIASNKKSFDEEPNYSNSIKNRVTNLFQDPNAVNTKLVKRGRYKLLNDQSKKKAKTSPKVTKVNFLNTLPKFIILKIVGELDTESAFQFPTLNKKANQIMNSLQGKELLKLNLVRTMKAIEPLKKNEGSRMRGAIEKSIAIGRFLLSKKQPKTTLTRNCFCTLKQVIELHEKRANSKKNKLFLENINRIFKVHSETLDKANPRKSCLQLDSGLPGSPYYHGFAYSPSCMNNGDTHYHPNLHSQKKKDCAGNYYSQEKALQIEAGITANEMFKNSKKFRINSKEIVKEYLKPTFKELQKTTQDHIKEFKNNLNQIFQNNPLNQNNNNFHIPVNNNQNNEDESESEEG